MPIMALYAEVRVAHRKRMQEKSMPQSNNQVEASEQVPDEADAAIDAAMDKAGVNLEQKAIQDAAVAEERRAAELIAQSRAQQEDDPVRATPVLEDESLISIMAQGRDYLLERLRQHAAEAQAKKDAYKPPPLTERQLAVIEEEQAAGRRARERHEAEMASRPAPPAKEKWDGDSTPVHRPGSLVPDPRVISPSGSVAGSRQFSADA